ncbi:hypothetical protein ASE25_05925 [Terrabacter sp. Root85]|nr:hypothetical protein ASE25_05925 [Terrabacter sp. Root85]
MAVAAYSADLTKARPADHVRDLVISVHVENPDAWTKEVQDDVVDLLAWLTGDIWTLDLIPAAALAIGQMKGLADIERVMLLSGGLDSLCGAVISLDDAANTLHIGHRDAARAVRHAQEQIRKTLASANNAFEWQRDDLGVTTRKKERSTRSRSLLFMSMGIAAASARHASEVIVPENGSTSVNYPLTPARSGALTTRSTHPFTFYMLNRVLSGLGLDVVVRNPYEMVTKGQMLEQAAAAAQTSGFTSFLHLTGESLSCAKLDSGRYKGGDPNLNCGLCVACLVRRGAYVAAQLADPTTYASQRLTGDSLAKLRYNRHGDLWAIEYAQKHPIASRDLISGAPWPEGANVEAYLDVARRGRKELFDAPQD